MGVEAIKVEFPFEAQLKPIQRAEPPAGKGQREREYVYSRFIMFWTVTGPSTGF